MPCLATALAMRRHNSIMILALGLALLVSGCVMTQSHLEQGRHLFDNKHYDRAAAELEKAAAGTGDFHYYIAVYSLLGDAYLKNDEPSRALSIYRNALQIIRLQQREFEGRSRDIGSVPASAKGENSSTARPDERDGQLKADQQYLAGQKKIIQGKIRDISR